jgi:hypothetical protein
MIQHDQEALVMAGTGKVWQDEIYLPFTNGFVPLFEKRKNIMTNFHHIRNKLFVTSDN